ncbi:2-oxoglutarate (2OG) and Fe(II)-dependent oxygenase superfamily protein [Melia azedarach]|uniref:2-oxoglutarate (2OG) and Fe(II)-dependent oxygenase superfamily protein n=1 Tax=Melia azedarach TaxID=155640 RepID=A0ACC1XSC0_MELAZ|nr:2-oxoglutarate (2OG) and Fe(II)-dependent oxygenase superfamily protein [Melia azedarach]
MADQNEASAVLNCIDLSNPDIHHSASLIKQACMDSGFFYVINHGISKEFMAEVFVQSKKFFTLPMEEKMKLMVETYRGYKLPLKNQFIDQETNQQAHGEAYALIKESPDADKIADKPLLGPNVWPPADVFPGWKETMLKYQQEVLNVGRAVSRLIAIALDLNVDFFDQPEFLGNALPYVSFNHYGVEGADPSKEYILGTPAHSDPSLITLLATDDIPGLQICRDVHANPRIWKYVSPLKGSTMHRVLFRQDRYTIAFFVYPSHDAIIECFPSCKSEENPPKYPPIKSEELLSLIFRKVAAGRTPRDITED